MKKEKIIFDLDGVLLDSEGDLEWLDRAIRKALKEIGVPTTRKNIEKLYPGGLSNFRELVAHFPVPPEEAWQIRDKYYVREKLKMIEEGKLKPFSDVEQLYKLKKSYSLGVISNSPAVIVDHFVKYYEFEDLFQDWVGRGSELADLEKIKPSTHFFREIRAEMGQGKYTYIGDRKSDKEFAKNSGMEFIYLARGGKGFDNLIDLVSHLL
ncbi:HAD-IA family hydrolase [Candidatus Bipolaricaulota bacterium]|nr:HAD-IA family hydrolase [Candidatus Bipolaricaulota bacterium]